MPTLGIYIFFNYLFLVSNGMTFLRCPNTNISHIVKEIWLQNREFSQSFLYLTEGEIEAIDTGNFIVD